MFGGPNGLGKSTLKSYLSQELLGVYINPDEIEQEARDRGVLDLSPFRVTSTKNAVSAFFCDNLMLGELGRRIIYSSNQLHFSGILIDSYVASAVADFLRHCLLDAKLSFTFETVMSHPSKVEILEKAQRLGFRTYLYYVATDDPAINISRVENRVKLGGHAVPADRIESRYHRSIDLLNAAIACTNRAYIFDNSGDHADRKQTWLAEVTEGKTLELKSDRIPGWFKRAVLDKIQPQYHDCRLK
jgi:predicted ABC-type ATPase